MIRVSDLFKIGIGPSSSHTVGPMVAANRFLQDVQQQYRLEDITAIDIELYGSLAATGKGHATDTAVLLGLLGHEPKTIDTSQTEQYLQPIMEENRLNLAGGHTIDFDYQQHLHWYDDTTLAYHPNALTITAGFSTQPNFQQTYYSVGGGFVLNADEISSHLTQSKEGDGQRSDNQSHQHQGHQHSDDEHNNHSMAQHPAIAYDFSTAKQLLEHCQIHDISISELVLANELQYAEEQEIYQYLDDIWAVMENCVKQGCQGDGILPGGLDVKRRSKKLHQQLLDETEQQTGDHFVAMDWVNLYALAVNEENANGGKVVTAPTNGAAGIIPAVLHYYRDFLSNFSQQGVYDFLLTATAIGSLIKQNASISGAEVGCQGEVGSACAMAAAGLAQVLGATPAQCLNAAEIGLEHNLGLTCDPIDGLVQVPCIERNAMASVKAINATRLALRGDGEHFVSLDKAIQTMKETGRDMHDKYKETARGGLAIYAKNHASYIGDGKKVNELDISQATKIIPTATIGVSVNYSQC